MAHLKILTLPYTAPNRSLTKRQREALEWVGDGKTMQDIAIIMGLTSATVEKHLRLAREALAVENHRAGRAQSRLCQPDVHPRSLSLQARHASEMPAVFGGMSRNLRTQGWRLCQPILLG